MKQLGGMVYDIEAGQRLAPILKYPLLVRASQRAGNQVAHVVYDEQQLGVMLSRLELVTPNAPLMLECLVF